MVNLPQELIDHIILLSDYETIKCARHILSKYAYKKSFDFPFNKMLEYGDIHALTYNPESLKNVEKTLINRIIVHTKEQYLENTLKWANDIGYTWNEFTIRLILIKNCDATTRIALDYLLKTKFNFHSYYYNLSVYWENYEFILFLIKHKITPNLGITEVCISKRKIKLLDFCIKHNLIDLTTVYKYITGTLDKTYIKKASKLVPIHILVAVNHLKQHRINPQFILWVLKQSLFLDNNHQLNESIYLLSKANYEL